MNDFTKEELQIIHLDMTTYIRRTNILAESPSHKALRDKVESMIDNYKEPCKHEWSTESEKISPGIEFYSQCKKCRKKGYE